MSTRQTIPETDTPLVPQISDLKSPPSLPPARDFIPKEPSKLCQLIGLKTPIAHFRPLLAFVAAILALLVADAPDLAWGMSDLDLDLDLDLIPYREVGPPTLRGLDWTGLDWTGLIWTGF